MQNSYDMCALPSGLYNQLRGVLSSCGPFSTDRELQTVFVDSRISLWRENVPQASSRAERVEALINFLCDKHNVLGENAMILFLSVLRDRTHSGDACHQRLVDSADALKNNAPPTDVTNPQSGPSALTIQNKHQELAKYEQQLQRLKMQIASVGGETTAPIGLLDQRDEIAAKIESLQAELRALEH